VVESQNRGPILVDQKTEIRRLYRRHRESLDRDYRHTASRAIVARLLAWEAVAKAGRVMTYLSFNAEVETFPLVRALFAQGKSVAVPYIHEGAINLIPAEISNLDHDLQMGPMGILEPRPDRLRPLDPKAIDIHVVPGLVFDEVGFRIGYGKGHYDRFLLLRSPHSIVVGAAFDIQLSENLPHEVWDVPMDFIATESQWIVCSIARSQLPGQLGLFQHPRLP
jgi:5-formyltetrahydrofolate cyclo-ligase